MRKLIFRVVIPLFILAAGVFTAMTLVALKPKPEPVKPEFNPPLVRVQDIALKDVAFTVRSQGTVRPGRESQLVPEVSGIVTEVSPALEDGSFFKAGDLLFKVDSFDFQQAVITAKADLSRARLALSREEAESKVARAEWSQLGGGEADPLTLREPQVAEARAALAAAEANVARAERDLERTTISAPYDGRVLREQVAVGQFVNRGTPVADLYAIDRVRISLPVPNKDLPFIDVPAMSMQNVSSGDLPTVTIITTLGDQQFQRAGYLTGTEGEINPSTRLLHLIAEVKDPYRQNEPGAPPLTSGMYVEAEIEGVAMSNLAVIPRGALWGEDRVLLVDRNDQVYFRQVTIVRETPGRVYVSKGLANADRLVLSRIEAVTEGMRVRITNDDQGEAAGSEQAAISNE